MDERHEISTWVLIGSIIVPRSFFPCSLLGILDFLASWRLESCPIREVAAVLPPVLSLAQVGTIRVFGGAARESSLDPCFGCIDASRYISRTMKPLRYAAALRVARQPSRHTRTYLFRLTYYFREAGTRILFGG